MPASARASRDKLFEIKTDVAAGLIQEGVFSTPVDGLTVYIRNISPEGELLGILVHENRKNKAPVTYLAERGGLQHSDQGPRLLMVNGNIQRVDVETGQINILYFDEYGFLLAPFAKKGPERFIKPRERFLGDLLNPEETPGNRKHWSRLIARGHEQLTSPIYALTFTAIALAGLLPGRYRRRHLGGQIFAIVLLCLAIRLTGMAIQNAAVRDLALIKLTYMIPLGSFALALLFLFQDRLRKPVPENAEAEP
jgi:lipopolysaccharide export system permease protein